VKVAAGGEGSPQHFLGFGQFGVGGACKGRVLLLLLLLVRGFELFDLFDEGSHVIVLDLEFF
jgi:hypothetical protein